MSMLYIGVDIGGTATKYGVFTVEGKLISKWEAPTALGQHGSGILPAVAGVGVGIPGPVRNDGKVERCVNLDWHDVVPAQELSALLQGIPVTAGNDANMAAMGEYWQGSGKGYRSAVFITLGTGVGSGIILDGKMIHGAKGLGGEVGHIVVGPTEPEQCGCAGNVQ